MFDKYIQWVKSHERHILVLAFGAIVWAGIGRIDTLIANHDHANLEQAQIADKAQADKNATTAALAQQQAAQYLVLAQQEAADKALLVQQNATLTSALAARQKTDATLPPNELANRWLTLVPTADPITLDDKGGLRVSTSGAVATVQELEKVPVLTQELANETKIEEGDAALLVARNAQVATLDTQIAGLNTKATLDAKVYTDQIAVVKAEARKSKLKWFAAGFVSGLTLGIWKF